MMALKVRSKQDLIKALGKREFIFIEESEVVSDADIRALSDKLRALIRSQKRIHVSLVERLPL